MGATIDHRLLLAGLATVPTVLLPFGPAAGGYLAGRSGERGVVRGAIVGALAAVPITLFLLGAATGSLEPAALSVGGLSIGLVPPAEGSLAAWQWAGIALLAAGYVVGCAALGGALADARDRDPPADSQPSA